MVDAMTYKIGGGWGNRIVWLNKEQFVQPGTHFKVVGWKPRIPRVADFLEGQFENGTARFQFTDIEVQESPSDMFFATVTFIGYG